MSTFSDPTIQRILAARGYNANAAGLQGLGITHGGLPGGWAPGTLQGLDISKLISTTQKVATVVSKAATAADQASARWASLQAKTTGQQTAPSDAYRDVQGKGGWVYRQYADGRIEIVTDPRAGKKGPTEAEKAEAAALRRMAAVLAANGHATQAQAALVKATGLLSTKSYNSAGRVLTSGKAYNAIVAEIGPYEAGEQGIPGAASLIKGRRGKQALDVTGKAVAAGLTGAATVTGLLTAAGVSSTVPVAGWIAAGGMVVAAGAVATISAIKNRKATKKQIAAIAKKHGMPDANKVPGFALRVLKMSATKRAKLGNRLEKALKKKEKGKFHAIGRNRKRLQAKLAVIAAVILMERAEARKKTAVQGFGAFGVARINGVPLNGIGNIHFAEIKGLSGDFHGLDDGEFAARLKRADDGAITEGGVQSPREAAAFVYGYLVKRYIPTRTGAGKLDSDKALKVAQLAQKFYNASRQADDGAAVVAVLAIGATSSPIDTIKGALSAVYKKWTTADPGRNLAIQVLQHASSLLGALGEPTAASKIAVAAAGEEKQRASAEAGVLSQLRQGFVDVVDEVVDTVHDATAFVGAVPTKLAQQAEKTIEGAVTGAAAVVESSRETAAALARAASEKADALAAAGMGELKALLSEARSIGGAIEKAQGDAAAALKAKAAGLGTLIDESLDAVRATGDAVQQKLVAEFDEKYRGALAAAGQARDLMTSIPGMIESAVQAKITDAAGLIRKVADKAKNADVCAALPGPAALVCRHPVAFAVGPVVLLGGVVGLIFLLRGRSRPASPAVSGYPNGRANSNRRGYLEFNPDTLDDFGAP